MKITPTPHRRALAALVPATLLLAAPAVAQDAAPPAASPVQTTTTPPPVVQTLPETSAQPAQPSGATPMTNGVAARNGIGDPNSATPIAPEAIAQAEEARAALTRPTASARAPAPRATQRSAPVAAAPASQPAVQAAAPAPVASAPVAQPAPAAPVQPEAAQADTATTDTTTTDSAATADQGAPVWPWLVGALIVLGALAAFFLRRRNRVEEYDDVYEEPVVQHVAEPVVVAPVAAPVVQPVVATQTQGHGRLEPQFLRNAAVAAPVVVASVAEQVEVQAVEAELAEPEAEDVAALTAATTHGNRPWLEFAMRPVRAGSNADDALVEIELTVGNSGAVAAQDVRISTFMFADGSASRGEMERLLTEHSAASEVAPVTIAPGEGTRVDATLSLPRDQLGDETRTFNPVILADARYRMADGTEGRTSASFTIGMIGAEGDDMGGIAIYRPQMSDDIEARLHGAPAHA